MELLLYWLFFEFIGCSIARLAFPLLSFGRVRVHPIGASTGDFNWLGYRWDEAGHMVIARDVAGFLGFLIMVIVFLSVVLTVRPF